MLITIYYCTKLPVFDFTVYLKGSTFVRRIQIDLKFCIFTFCINNAAGKIQNHVVIHLLIILLLMDAWENKFFTFVSFPLDEFELLCAYLFFVHCMSRSCNGMLINVCIIWLYFDTNIALCTHWIGAMRSWMTLISHASNVTMLLKTAVSVGGMNTDTLERVEAIIF